ncbi:hypothetical protein ACA910_007027 [Epithemia clementina (nom. ined.)]
MKPEQFELHEILAAATLDIPLQKSKFLFKAAEPNAARQSKTSASHFLPTKITLPLDHSPTAPSQKPSVLPDVFSGGVVFDDESAAERDSNDLFDAVMAQGTMQSNASPASDKTHTCAPSMIPSSTNNLPALAPAPNMSQRANKSDISSGVVLDEESAAQVDQNKILLARLVNAEAKIRRLKSKVDGDKPSAAEGGQAMAFVYPMEELAASNARVAS